MLITKPGWNRGCQLLWEFLCEAGLWKEKAAMDRTSSQKTVRTRLRDFSFIPAESVISMGFGERVYKNPGRWETNAACVRVIGRKVAL